MICIFDHIVVRLELHALQDYILKLIMCLFHCTFYCNCNKLKYHWITTRLSELILFCHNNSMSRYPENLQEHLAGTISVKKGLWKIPLRNTIKYLHAFCILISTEIFSKNAMQCVSVSNLIRQRNIGSKKRATNFHKFTNKRSLDVV